MIALAPMRRRDVRTVVGIERRVYPTPWSAGLFRDELARRDRDDDRVYLVARADPGRTLVGYAGLLDLAGDGHVATVAVDPGRQGGGVGTRLVLGLARRARERGLGSLTLEVRMSNLAAQRLYGRFGFVPAGTRVAYYPDNGESALVMWAHEVDGEAYGARLDAIEAALPHPTTWSAA